MTRIGKKIKVVPERISFKIYTKDSISVKFLRNLYGFREETFGFLNQHVADISIDEWDEDSQKYIEYDEFLQTEYNNTYTHKKASLPADYLAHQQRLVILCYYDLGSRKILAAGLTITVADNNHALRFDDKGAMFLQELKQEGNDLRLGGIAEFSNAAVRDEFKGEPMVSTQIFTLGMLLSGYFRLNGVVDKGMSVATKRLTVLYKQMFRRTFGLKADEIEEILVPKHYSYEQGEDTYLTVFRADSLEGSDLVRIMERQRGLVHLENVLKKRFPLQILADAL